MDRQEEVAAGGPLVGVRVLEIGMLVAAPFATRLLADLGAEVIKVETPDRPDALREWGHVKDDGRSLWWPIAARNKKLVTLNLRHEEGQRLLLELVPFAEAGVDEIGFADTIGVAGPGQVRRLVERGCALGVSIAVHLHNTRNTGYANVYAALEGGAATIDAAVGGLGGCPFAPGATGNVATEDVLYLLEREGVAPPVDMERLKAAAIWLRVTAQLSLPGTLHALPVGGPVAA